jgi:hypothetical protein
MGENSHTAHHHWDYCIRYRRIDSNASRAPKGTNIGFHAFCNCIILIYLRFVGLLLHVQSHDQRRTIFFLIPLARRLKCGVVGKVDVDELSLGIPISNQLYGSVMWNPPKNPNVCSNSRLF